MSVAFRLSLSIAILLLDACAAAPVETVAAGREVRCAPNADRAESNSCLTRCEDGDALSCLLVGRALHLRGESERAAAYLDYACYDRVAAACVLLSELHTIGAGVARDYVSASYFFHLACEYGHRGACGEDQVFVTGRNETLRMDTAGTALYFDDTCWQGSADGCFSAAVMHTIGMGVARDLRRAQRFYGRACTLGHTYSCAQLEGPPIRLTRSGPATPNRWARTEATAQRSRAAAAQERGAASARPLETLAKAHIYDTACARRNATGCLALGRLYANGGALPQDGRRAEDYFELACSAGDGAACEELRRRREVPQPLNLPTPVATLASAH